jgi:signal transduction histidine kinase
MASAADQMWRARLRECLLLGAFAVLLVAGSIAAVQRQVPPRRPLDVLAWLLIAAAFAAVVVRGRWPLGAMLAGALLVAGYLAAGYPYGPVIFVVCVLAYALAAHGPGRATVIGLAGGAAVLVVAQLQPAAPRRLAIEAGVLLVAVCAWLGVPAWIALTVRLWQAHLSDVVERRRQEEQTGLERAERELAEERAERAQSERDRADERTGRERAGRELADERLRLSREIHDVVAHSLSLISLQSGAALHVWRDRPDRAEAAVRTIRDTSVEALRELREAIDVLRGTREGSLPERPGVDRIPALVARLDGDQQRVTLEVRGPRRELAAEVEACLYRVAQEALTNVVRHACATLAEVRLWYTEDGVSIEVVDDGRGPGPDGPDPGEDGPGLGGDGRDRTPDGHGIRGMRERVAAVGGRVEVGTGPAGGFRVHAWVPVGPGDGS